MVKGYKHLTSNQKESILRVFDETKSAKITADQLGIRYQRVHHYLKRQGIELTGYRETACYRNFDLVVQLAQEGYSYSEIARRVGTNHHRVKEFLDRYEVDHPGHVQTMENNSHWKGGRMTDKTGYVLLKMPDHHLADSHGYVREHRLVMEKKLGRRLLPDEVVHHIDGNKENNSPDNLQLYATNGKHLAKSLKGKVPNWTEEGRQRTLEGCRRPRGRKRKSNP